MPFKFEAEIETADAKNLWTRSIYSLSTLSDTTKITIRQPLDTITRVTASNQNIDENDNGTAELQLTAVNFTKTSSLNCAFDKSFFKTFKIDGELPNDAIQDDDNKAKCFSFLVNSKNLTVLFKDCGEDSKKFKFIVIDEDRISTDDSHENDINKVKKSRFMNKFFVELDTNTGLTKKYTLNFIKAKESFDYKINSIHNHILLRQNAKDRKLIEDSFVLPNINRIHSLTILTDILRNFLSIFPSQLEDFRLEIYPNLRRILFHGYNRQQLLTQKSTTRNGNNNRNYSTAASFESQPMTLSSQLSLNDLVTENFYSTSDEEEDKKFKYQVSFRLRDFKIFVNLIGPTYSEFGISEDKQSRMNHQILALNSEDENNCDIIFSSSGAPIIFEKKYYSMINGQGESQFSNSHHGNGNSIASRITLVTMNDPESDSIIIKDSEKSTTTTTTGTSTIHNEKQGGAYNDGYDDANDTTEIDLRKSIQIKRLQNIEPVRNGRVDVSESNTNSKPRSTTNLTSTSTSNLDNAIKGNANNKALEKNATNNQTESLFVRGNDNDDYNVIGIGEFGVPEAIQTNSKENFRDNGIKEIDILKNYSIRGMANKGDDYEAEEEEVDVQDKQSGDTGNEQHNLRSPDKNQRQNDRNDPESQSEVVDSIFWDNEKFHKSKAIVIGKDTHESDATNKTLKDTTSTSSKRAIKDNDDQEYQDGNSSKRLRLSELGPTQNVEHVKGIFD